jgi:hypothetical protein
MPETATAVPSLRDHLRVMLPRIAPVLLSPTAADRIARWSTVFPPVACMIECHIGVDEPRSDFLVRFLRSGAEPAALTGADGVRPPVDTTANAATWATLREFSRRWSEPESPLAAFAQTWLEFDLPRQRAGTAMPAPSFFADLDPVLAGSIDPAGVALAILLGGQVNSELLGNVATCVGELPPGARWLSLGVMLGRQTDAVRVCVAGLPADEVLPYLERIGWTGSVTQLQTICGRLAGFTNTVALALDVDASVQPRIGIEYNLEVSRSLHDSVPRWRPFLDRLVEDGLCARHKRDPLLACIGFDHERTDPASWPADRRAESDRYGPNVLSVLLRRLAHIKVVFEPGRPAEAKAYLELTHDWLSFDPASRQARLAAAPGQSGG